MPNQDAQEIVQPSKNGGPSKLIADCISSPMDARTCEANARLIAAAPELLDFAEQVARSACLEQFNGNTCICFACEAKRVIAKATSNT